MSEAVLRCALPEEHGEQTMAFQLITEEPCFTGLHTDLCPASFPQTYFANSAGSNAVVLASDHQFRHTSQGNLRRI